LTSVAQWSGSAVTSGWASGAGAIGVVTGAGGVSWFGRCLGLDRLAHGGVDRGRRVVVVPVGQDVGLRGDDGVLPVDDRDVQVRRLVEEADLLLDLGQARGGDPAVVVARRQLRHRRVGRPLVVAVEPDPLLGDDVEQVLLLVALALDLGLRGDELLAEGVDDPLQLCDPVLQLGGTDPLAFQRGDRFVQRPLGQGQLADLGAQ
jgi:hypothetical protein